MTTTLPMSNLQSCFNPNHQQLSSYSPKQISLHLQTFGCDGCDLGKQSLLNSPVVYRGNLLSKKMIIGEGPGKDEDEKGKPFVGPAGQLLDRIFAAAGWNTNTDWYLGNILKCRPIAPPGSYKQNKTPTVKQRKACKPYIEREIDCIQPHIVVLLGKTAAESLLDQVTNQPMYKIVGKTYRKERWPDTTFFVMYHPAAILHAKNDQNRYTELRKATWQHVLYLKEIIHE